MTRDTVRDTKESLMAKQLCKYKCVICGWPEKVLKDTDSVGMVEGAHIKEFKKDADADVFKNIVALCPNHHTEFDHNYFYIDLDYTIVHYDQNSALNGMKLEIKRYLDPRYLLDRKTSVINYWNNIGIG